MFLQRWRILGLGSPSERSLAAASPIFTTRRAPGVWGRHLWQHIECVRGSCEGTKRKRQGRSESEMGPPIDLIGRTHRARPAAATVTRRGVVCCSLRESGSEGGVSVTAWSEELRRSRRNGGHRRRSREAPGDEEGWSPILYEQASARSAALFERAVPREEASRRRRGSDRLGRGGHRRSRAGARQSGPPAREKGVIICVIRRLESVISRGEKCDSNVLCPFPPAKKRIVDATLPGQAPSAGRAVIWRAVGARITLVGLRPSIDGDEILSTVDSD